MAGKAGEVMGKYDRPLLISLLVLIGAIYLLLAMVPKHGDFYTINDISCTFAYYGLEFLDRVIPQVEHSIAYPPTYYILEGYWFKLGSLIFHYDLYSLDWDRSTVPGIIPIWGMLFNITGLFALVALAYLNLANKWLSLLAFGTFTFVSVIVMGQIDVFSALFVFISMALMLKASGSERYLLYIFLSVVALGVSAQFKTYGVMLLPVHLIFAYSILKGKGIRDIKACGVLAAALVAFIISFFIIWVPFTKWFGYIILSGKSNWLLNLQISPVDLPPFHTISIWLLGYAIISYDFLHHALYGKAPVGPRHFILYTFTAVAWFFATVYTHPQWWVFILPAALLVLDSFRSKLNYVFCMGLMTLFLLYPMMWVDNIDSFLGQYLPSTLIPGKYSVILVTAIVSLLIIWIISLRRELYGGPDRVSGPSPGPAAAIVMLVAPFVLIILLTSSIALSTGIIGTKNLAYGPADDIYGNGTAGQSFISAYDGLDGVYLRFNDGGSGGDSIVFHLRETPSSPDIVEVEARPEGDDLSQAVRFPAIAGSAGKEYYFFVESPGSAPDDPPAIYYNTADTYHHGTAYLDNKPIGGDLYFITRYRPSMGNLMPLLG